MSLKLNHDVFIAYVEDIDAWKSKSSNNTYDALARAIGVKSTVVYNYMEWNEAGDGPRTFPPLENLIAICKHINKYSAISIICQASNGIYSKSPKTNPDNELDVFTQLDNLHSKTIDLSKELQSAWVDRKITKDELSGIARAAIDNQAASQEIVEWAQAMSEGGGRQ